MYTHYIHNIYIHSASVKLFSPVWLFVTPWAVAWQTSLSMGFSRQEHQSRLSFPPPGDLLNLGIEPESLASPALEGRFFTTASIYIHICVYVCVCVYPYIHICMYIHVYKIIFFLFLWRTLTNTTSKTKQWVCSWNSLFLPCSPSSSRSWLDQTVEWPFEDLVTEPG